MHESVETWAREVLKTRDIVGRRVIEVGSYDENGSLRYWIQPHCRSYVGIDMRPGPGVDKVSTAEMFATEMRVFELVICTEVLEHAHRWRATINALKDLTKPGHRLLVTTRSPGFPRHNYPSDYWRFTVEDFKAMFEDFDILDLREDPEQAGVFMLARKPREARNSVNLMLFTAKEAPAE